MHTRFILETARCVGPRNIRRLGFPQMSPQYIQNIRNVFDKLEWVELATMPMFFILKKARRHMKCLIVLSTHRTNLLVHTVAPTVIKTCRALVEMALCNSSWYLLEVSIDTFFETLHFESRAGALFAQTILVRHLCIPDGPLKTRDHISSL